VLKLHFTPVLSAGALLLGLACTAHAADTPTVYAPPSYPEILLDDVKHVVTAPARWQEREWQNLGLLGLGVVGAGLIVDRPLRDEMRHHAPNNNRFLFEVERFGADYSLGVLGGFYLAGALGDNARATAVAQDGLSACLIASGLITPAIKLAAGRDRPRANTGTANFHPFSGASSFPSGHTTQAFALASVIAAHYDDTWVSVTSYTVASLVGVARSYHDAHFASDVLAGALIGTLVGISVVEHSQTMRGLKLSVLPAYTEDLLGVRIAGSY
jgi:membrane-associated phospholipid phosphatase